LIHVSTGFFIGDLDMATTFDESTITHSSHSLQATMAAARVSFTWLGVQKTLTSQQKNQAADSFGAEGKYLSAGKKLIDTSDPIFRACTAIRTRTINYFRGISIPYPEVGIRLIRQDSIPAFDHQLSLFKEELREAVYQLDNHYEELKLAARERLGELYNPADYPHSLIGMFGIQNDYPSVEPPSYLKQLNPDLYAQECQRMQTKFDEAVQLAEDAFLTEISKLINHLSERLTGQADGKPKVFRDTAITNLTEFFKRFRKLNVRSNDQLDALVADAQQIVAGVTPKSLRSNGPVRREVANQLAEIQTDLDQMIMDRPRRNIIRRAK
jgi:hypothetical protein